MKYRYLFLAMVVSLTGCRSNITQTADTLTIELGEELNFHPMDAFSTDNAKVFDNFVIDDSKVNTNEVGTYTVNIGYKADTYTIQVHVMDTTAPTISIKEKFPIFPKVPALDNDCESFIKEKLPTVTADELANCEDLSKCELLFLVDGAECKEIKLYAQMEPIQIFARDSYGNQSEVLQCELPLQEVYPHSYFYNVNITEWGINPFTKDTVAESCEYTEEWRNFVKDRIFELYETFASSLSTEKMDEIINIIALDVASVYGENASEQAVLDTIDMNMRIFIHLSEQEQARKTAEEKAKQETQVNANLQQPSQSQQLDGQEATKQELENAGFTVHDDETKFEDPEKIRQKFLNDHPGSKYLREDEKFFYFELEDGSRVYTYKNFEFGFFYDHSELVVQ